MCNIGRFNTRTLLCPSRTRASLTSNSQPTATLLSQISSSSLDFRTVRFSTIKRRTWKTSTSCKLEKSMNRSNCNHRKPIKVKFENSYTPKSTALTCLFRQVPTEPSNCGSLRILRVTSAFRRLLVTKEVSLT